MQAFSEHLFFSFQASWEISCANKVLSFPAKPQLNPCPHVVQVEHHWKGLGKANASLAWKPRSSHTASRKALGLFPRPLIQAIWGRTGILAAWDFSTATSLTNSHTVQGLDLQDFVGFFPPGWKESVQAICPCGQELAPHRGQRGCGLSLSLSENHPQTPEGQWRNVHVVLKTRVKVRRRHSS